MKYKEFMYEMSNVRSDKTGLSMVIYISPKGKSKHSARIKVGKEYGTKFNPYETVSITVEDEPKVIGDIGKLKQKDIKKIINFVKLNKDIILQHWNDEIDSADTINKLKKV